MALLHDKFGEWVAYGAHYFTKGGSQCSPDLPTHCHTLGNRHLETKDLMHPEIIYEVHPSPESIYLVKESPDYMWMCVCVCVYVCVCVCVCVHIYPYSHTSL